MDDSDVAILDDGSRRDSRGRRRLPKAEGERLARESFCSNLSLRAFARQEGVNYHTLVLWRHQLRQSHGDIAQGSAGTGTGSGKKVSQAISFAELCLPASGGCAAGLTAAAAPASAASLEVQLPDGTLLRGGDASAFNILHEFTYKK